MIEINFVYKILANLIPFDFELSAIVKNKTLSFSLFDIDLNSKCDQLI